MCRAEAARLVCQLNHEHPVLVMAHSVSSRAIGRIQRLAANSLHQSVISCAMNPIVLTNVTGSSAKAVSDLNLGMSHHIVNSRVSLGSGDFNLRHFARGSQYTSSCCGASTRASLRDSTCANRTQSSCAGLRQHVEQGQWPAPLQGGAAQHARHLSVITGGSSPENCTGCCYFELTSGEVPLDELFLTSACMVQAWALCMLRNHRCRRNQRHIMMHLQQS